VIPPRPTPLLDQFAFACERLSGRMAGPVMDSGDGTDTPTLLAGQGDWGRDAASYPRPWPPPFTTIA
jgi:hypothetical protein